ncbi:hypothetical protein F5884DRAFT_762171 [Xylogone sp. PMI_703]|nr:hypothetical protein F5884DRAFT_762171 [Xylogone sp. PMI_703]
MADSNSSGSSPADALAASAGAGAANDNANTANAPPTQAQLLNTNNPNLPTAASQPVVKPRRPHHKSRTGCIQCKQRKIKCDETKPTCNKCDHYGTACSYLQTHPLHRGLTHVDNTAAQQNPTPAPNPIGSNLSGGPGQLYANQSPNFSLLDLEILHFWTSTSAFEFLDFPSGARVFQVNFVQEAINYPFLMYEILSLSALHLAYLRPDRASIYRNIATSHHATALSLGQAELRGISSENCHACFAFSTMIYIHAWASQGAEGASNLFFRSESLDDVGIQIVKLHRGALAVIDGNIFQLVINGPLGPLLEAWRDFDKMKGSQPPLPPDEQRHLEALAEAWNARSARQLPLPLPHIEILEKTLFTLKMVFSLSAYNREISSLSSAISWLTMIPDEFIALVEQKIPEALLLVATYCVLLKRVEYMWWVKGKSRYLLERVLAELGQGWERWTYWPIEEVLRPVQGTQGTLGPNSWV